MLCLLGVASSRPGSPHLREQLSKLLSRRAKSITQRAHVLPRQVIADRLEEREVRERQLGFAAGSGHHDAAPATCSIGELVDEPGLAHPRLTANDHHSPIASKGGQERVLQDRDFGLAADQLFAQDSCKCHI
jgi:hypothetical protein